MIIPEAYEKLLSEYEMDEIKDNLVLWNKLKGVSRSKNVGLPSLNIEKQKQKVVISGNGDDEFVGISASDAVNKLSKLTNVTNFENKYD